MSSTTSNITLAQLGEIAKGASPVRIRKATHRTEEGERVKIKAVKKRPWNRNHPGLNEGYEYVDAHHKGKNVGYLTLGMRGDKAKKGPGYIEHVNVLPEYKRKGIATAMYRHAQRKGMTPYHSDILSDEGRAWKESMSKYEQSRTQGSGQGVQADGHYRQASSALSERRLRGLLHEASQEAQMTKSLKERWKRDVPVVVTGSRSGDHFDARYVREDLDALARKHPKRRIQVHHGGARGIDNAAGQWANENRFASEVVHRADWKKHGRAAGPIRNQEMIDTAKPKYVLAYPKGESKGTRGAMKYAENKGYRVRTRELGERA